MAISENKVRLQVVIDRATADKIEELADAMNTSVSRMSAALLEAGIEDNEWVIKNIAGPARRVLDSWKRKSKGLGRATS